MFHTNKITLEKVQMYFLSLKTSLNNHHLKLYVMLNQSLILNALKISKFRSKSKVAAHNA